MQMNPAFDRFASDAGMPRQDHMNSMPTRRDALRDRLEKGAHRVSGEPRIGRCHHYDGVGHDINQSLWAVCLVNGRWLLLPSPFESERGNLF